MNVQIIMMATFERKKEERTNEQINALVTRILGLHIIFDAIFHK